MNQVRWIGRLVICGLLMTLLGVLVGCAGAAEAPSSPPAAREMAASDGGVIASAGPGEQAVPAAASGAAVPAEAPAMAGAVTAGGIQRKIIGRATVTLVVAEPEVAVAAITALMAEVQGYVANANLYKAPVGDEQLLQGTLTLRVPAARTDETLTRLAALAVEVTNQTLNREDVTDQYTDLEAQLRNLEATETELRALLAEVRAKPDARPDDILNVHNHLTNIRGQIDQIQGRRTMLDNLITLATIDVTLLPQPPVLPIVVEGGWQPTQIARDTLRTLVESLQGLATVAIWLALYLLPLLLLALAVLGLVVWVVRRLLGWFSRQPGAPVTTRPS